MKNKKIDKYDKKKVSREVGLEIGEICGKYFFDMQHLHYGYWTDGLEVKIANLHTAQDDYVDFLLSHIPESVNTVLDVGCGTGHISKKLLDTGYKVDCVSPSSYFAEHTRDLTGSGSEIFEMFYEDVKTDKRYDLILFSESFQYINLEKSLEQTSKLLNDKGHMLICDFFKKEIRQKGAVGGGHKLKEFYETIKNFSFKNIKDTDITEHTAPNIDILNDILINVAAPVANAVNRLIDSRHPLILKLLKWKYKKKIDKMHEKYFQGRRNGESFKQTKSYRLMLYEKK